MKTRRMTRVLPVATAALALLLAATAANAEGRVLGKVTDAEGNKLEQQVTLKLIPLDPSKTAQEGTPNKKGKFVFGLVPQGEWRLVAFAEGMRISRIDANIAVPDDDSLWSVSEEIPPGAELPSFAVTGVSKVTYDLAFEPYDDEPGEYGTGLPVSPIEPILNAIRENRLDEAIADVEANLERNPGNAALNYLAAFAHRLAGSNERALEAIETCLRVDPEFEGGAVLKGKILATMGETEQALALYRSEAGAASEQVRRDSLLEQAILLQELQRDDEAIAALEQLIEMAPDLAAAYGDLAALYLKTGQPDKAKVVTEKVMELGGSNPDLLYNLGVERFNNNDFESAGGYFDKVVEIAPDHPEAHLQLGYVNLNLGDTAAAIDHLKKFLEVAPGDHPGTPTAQAIVQQLSGS